MKKRRLETSGKRNDRLEKNAQDRKEQSVAEDKALDAAVKLSIKQFGA
jgi:hypothetical protein